MEQRDEDGGLGIARAMRWFGHRLAPWRRRVSAAGLRQPVRLGVVAAAAVVAAAGAVSAVGQKGIPDRPAARTDPFVGKLLVATPSMPDGRFARTVIYMVDHDDTGAFGLVVNRTMGRVPFADLLRDLKIEGEPAKGELPVHYGGPVEPGRGFFLHSLDYADDKTRVVGKGIGMTVDTEVVRAIARGEGPKRWLFAFGYAGWGPGQLDAEMATGHWVVVPVDADLVFAEDDAGKWQRALARESIEL